MVCERWRGLIALLLALAPLPARAEPENPCLACDREMRKTFESIQAWRRLHNGRYPGRLADLKSSGLMPFDGAICPEVLLEHNGADAAHNENSSRGPDGDPAGTYEYEMSDRVNRASIDRLYLPDDAGNYTRQDIKREVLKRDFSEQMPILRCSSHRAVAPPPFAGTDEARRNATIEGKVYWSGMYWEHLFLNDVPPFARDVNVLFGLKGPPFHTDRAPTLPEALDLRPWSSAFGDHVWWWNFPMFEEGSNRQRAADLRSLFQEEHGRIQELNGTKWWLDGLAQLQGRLEIKGENLYMTFDMLAFPWKRTGLKVGRLFKQAAWLQGTVWTTPPGTIAGWLVWHYADGQTNSVPIVYGKNTARFWMDQAQSKKEKGFPEAAWRYHETKQVVLKDRWVRVYRQDWENPRPDVLVDSLDFLSNPQSRAGPFLIAVNVFP